MKLYLLLFYLIALTFRMNCASWSTIKPIQKNGYQVTIRHDTKNSHLCIGVILSENFVLTSARCVMNFDAKELKIMYSVDDFHRTTEVDLIFVHPEYDVKTIKNDLAMLWMKTGVDLAPNVIQFVELPSKKIENNVYVIASDC